MTLRTIFLLLVGILLAISVTARADFGPGVWSQLQHNPNGSLRAKIIRLEMTHNRVEVSFKPVGIKTQAQQTSELCRQDAGMATVAVEYNQQIESLRQALKSGETVELGIQGPWSPCLNSVTLIK